MLKCPLLLSEAKYCTFARFIYSKKRGGKIIRKVSVCELGWPVGALAAKDVNLIGRKKIDVNLIGRNFFLKQLLF